MAYAQRYQLLAESLIVDNVLKLIKDNFKAQLDILYPVEAALPTSNAAYLKDFEERTFGKFMNLVFPALVADVLDGEDEEGEHAVDEEIKIGLSMAVTDVDESNVTRRMLKYARALRVVLMSGTWAEYLLGVPATQQMGFVNVKLTRRFHPIGQGKGETEVYGYMRPVDFVLTLNFSEG